MKVTAWFTDGSFYEVELSEKECGEHFGPQEAIAKAKEKLGATLLGEDMGHIKSWEVEEDFI